MTFWSFLYKTQEKNTDKHNGKFSLLKENRHFFCMTLQKTNVKITKERWYLEERKVARALGNQEGDTDRAKKYEDRKVTQKKTVCSSYPGS